jgi:hypothetical protein
MPRAKREIKLNTQKSEVVHEAWLQETPEGFSEPKGPVHDSGIVITNRIPEMRRIVFMNGRDPGQELMFHYHSKTHPLKHYTLFHGKEYDLPVEVIDHLENCAEKIYGYRQGASGHPEMYTKGLKYLYSCKTPRKVA